MNGKQQNFKRIVAIATKMRKKKSFLLDISKITGKEAAIITELVKNDILYSFFVKVQEIPIEEVYATCKWLQAQEELEKIKQKYKERNDNEYNS